MTFRFRTAGLTGPEPHHRSLGAFARLQNFEPFLRLTNIFQVHAPSSSGALPKQAKDFAPLTRAKSAAEVPREITMRRKNEEPSWNSAPKSPEGFRLKPSQNQKQRSRLRQDAEPAAPAPEPVAPAPLPAAEPPPKKSRLRRSGQMHDNLSEDYLKKDGGEAEQKSDQY